VTIKQPRRRNDEDAKWVPAYLEQSATDAREFLNEAQYEHAVRQILQLCTEEDPTHPKLADVDAVEEFHELRDKYGVLGKINLRVFFWVCKPKRMIVVLGAWKKEREGKTPQRIIKRIKWRKRRVEEQLLATVAVVSGRRICDERGGN